jgi:hypothetical protein
MFILEILHQHIEIVFIRNSRTSSELFIVLIALGEHKKRKNLMEEVKYFADGLILSLFFSDKSVVIFILVRMVSMKIVKLSFPH